MTDKGILNHRYPTALQTRLQPVLSQLLLRSTPPIYQHGAAAGTKQNSIPLSHVQKQNLHPVNRTRHQNTGQKYADTEKQDCSQPYWAGFFDLCSLPYRSLHPDQRHQQHHIVKNHIRSSRPSHHQRMIREAFRPMAEPFIKLQYIVTGSRSQRTRLTGNPAQQSRPDPRSI